MSQSASPAARTPVCVVADRPMTPHGRGRVVPWRTFVAVVAWSGLLLLSLGCSRGTDATSVPPIATGASGPTAAAAMATSKTCKLFSRAEIAEAIGTPVSEGADWGLASMGCEWSAGEDRAVQAIIVPDPEYWENLAGSEGGEALSGLGEEAFVAPWLGAFRAGALTPHGSVYVMSPKRDLSVSLLRKAVERAPSL